MRAQAVLRKDGHAAALETHCAAHKAHAVSTKCWSQFKGLHAALVQTLKLLRSPGAFPQLMDKLMERIEDAEIVVRRPLPDVAITHRRHVLEAFTPTSSQRPKHAPAHLPRRALLREQGNEPAWIPEQLPCGVPRCVPCGVRLCSCRTPCPRSTRRTHFCNWQRRCRSCKRC